MNRDEREEKLLEAVRKHLDESVEAIDARTAARLREIRVGALAGAEGMRRRFMFPRWVTVGGLATAAVAVAAGLWFAEVRKEPAVATIDDIEIVVAQEQMQLYEDLEFYRWLAEQENGG